MHFIWFQILLCSILILLASASSDSSSKFSALKSCLLDKGVKSDQLFSRGASSSGERLQYEDLNYQWSLLHGIIKPLAYLLPTSTRQVQAAVRCCRKTGVRVVARGGGHSYMKYGYGDERTLVVDLQRMNSVQILHPQESAALIGGGTRSGKIQAELVVASRRAAAQMQKGHHGSGSSTGFIIPIGICPMVGVAGFSMGGGQGYFSRLLGLGADNILEVELVDAEGDVHVINEHKKPDLYWAIRGGGGGNFGIVTEFKFRLYEAPAQITLAVAQFQLKDFPAFFKGWQGWVASSPPNHVGSELEIDEEIIEMELWSMKEQEGSAGAGELQKILGTWFPPVISLTLKRFTTAEFVVDRAQKYVSYPLTNPAQLANITRLEDRFWRRVKSFYVDKVLHRDEDIQKLYELVREFVPLSHLILEHLGGAVSEVGPTDTAWVHRDKLYSILVRVNSKDDFPDKPVFIGAKKFFEATKELLGHDESYQNYLDDSMPNFLRRYYGVNLERLVAVKKNVDPENVFHNPMTIPVHLH